MGTLGFGADDKEAVFRVLAALLHLGNVRFEVGRPHLKRAVYVKWLQ